ncbi:Cloroperoxidase [Gymnopus androsaceus JB14]|uniref:Cloroperoxidase n=1 Tax=Gymnopus androsaceus JB14 TaxID=1447944 RepID=A0A6A4HRS5_9AGAR|nr:Cloroperoxidase [Gymnopus androsaceus JB14]
MLPASDSTECLLSNIQDDCWDLEASTSTNPNHRSYQKDRSYIRPDGIMDARAPCPGLNTLANHGYIPRSGRDISFLLLLRAIQEVYNISLPISVDVNRTGVPNLCSVPAKMEWSFPSISYTLTLSSLCALGPGLKIAHRASLVHSDHPRETPDLNTLWDFLCFARFHSQSASLSSPVSETRQKPMLTGGLTLHDLASIRVSREAALPNKFKLNAVHEQVALGETSTSDIDMERPIPLSHLAQWFGEERIPDGWMRPAKVVGLFDARRVAGRLQKGDGGGYLDERRTGGLAIKLGNRPPYERDRYYSMDIILLE